MTTIRIVVLPAVNKAPVEKKIRKSYLDPRRMVGSYLKYEPRVRGATIVLGKKAKRRPFLFASLPALAVKSPFATTTDY